MVSFDVRWSSLDTVSSPSAAGCVEFDVGPGPTSLRVNWGDKSFDTLLPAPPGSFYPLPGNFVGYHEYSNSFNHPTLGVLGDGLGDYYRIAVTASLAGGTTEKEVLTAFFDYASMTGAVRNGGTLDDIMYGGSGNDRFSGAAGDDMLDGGAGSDTVSGGLGEDHVRGGSGSDVVRGDGGNDDVRGGSGGYPGDGNDTLYGGAGNDSLDGEAGKDRVYGEAGDDLLSGDTPFLLAPGDDTLDGGDGNDSLDGGGGKDNLFGGSGNDDLRGMEGTDRLNGDAGADTFVGGTGVDTLTSGADLAIDTFRFAVTDEFGDRIIGFESAHDVIEIIPIDGAAVTPDRFIANATPRPPASSTGTYLLYDTDTGVLRVDWDGAGGDAPVLLAQLIEAPSLSFSNVLF